MLTEQSTIPDGLRQSAEQTAPRSTERPEMIRASWCFVGLAFVLAALYLLTVSPGQRLFVSALTALLIIFAIGLAAIVHRPDPRMWAPTGIVLSTLGAGHLLRPEQPTSSHQELVFHLIVVVGHGVLIAALALVVRSRAYRDLHSVLADAAILALGAWVVGWVFLAQAHTANGDPSPALAVVRALDQPLAVIVLFLLVIVVFADSNRHRAITLLSAAIGATLIAHLAHTVAISSEHTTSARVLNAPLIFGAMLAGAGFLHPSVRSLFGTIGTARPRSLLARLLVTTSALVIPVVTLAISDPVSQSDRVVRVVSVSVLALAVMLRVVQAARASERAQAELIRSARTDPLTLLPNRELMLEHTARALSEAWRSNVRPTVMLIDVDRFKNINDSLGHAMGDAVLRTVAERLVSVLPESVIVSRVSGDEFVVLAPHTVHPGEALQLAERALESFREPMVLRQGDVFVAASIGVAQANPSTTTKAEDLLRQADTAMYRAKDAGRNRIALFDDTMLEKVTQRLEVETALYRALERRELQMYHQPIIDIAKGEVIGFEALMRWQRADGTLVSPADFIPIAEETGIIVPIGAWALLEALTHLDTWISEGACSPDASVSVNVSPRQLHDPHFPSLVDEALRRSGMAPEHLWLEVTESIMITEPELAKRSLNSLCAMGVRVAVDDFGTGYSSLSLLQQFPINRIKIDRAFVKGVADDEGARSLVRTIIAMGASLGLDLVAEGVETIGQMRALHELGCNKAQGFLISKPVPADAIRSTVAALDRIADWPLLRSSGPRA